MTLDRASCYRALTARDARFDGVFYVGVTSTRIYCRPVCRVKMPRAANCRYFSHAAAAERAGFRPCLRCRPELAPGNAPGNALVDATAQLAERATRAIAAGALNGGSLEALAGSLGVSSRHMRRAVAAHAGVSPIDLATTYRLLLAKRLLHETTLPVAQVAFAAGFESLRRFNASFKGRYRLSPAALRRDATTGEKTPPSAAARAVAHDARLVTAHMVSARTVTARPVTARPVTARPVTARPVTARPVTARPVTARTVGARTVGAQSVAARPVKLRRDASSTTESTTDTTQIDLTLEYRPPLDWDSLLAFLAARATPGAEYVDAGRYVSTVRITRSGATHADARASRALAPVDVVTGHLEVALHAPRPARASRGRGATPERAGQVHVRLSPSLLPVLMPLLARVRDLLDLDANPDAIARHLVQSGVAVSAQSFGGIRIPGTLDGFALALRAILGQQVSVKGATTVMGRLVTRFGEPYSAGDPRLTRLMPAAATIGACSTGDIATLGMPGARADAVIALARAVAGGALDLAPGGDVDRTMRTLTALPGIGDWTAHYIAMRALRWPDAFPANDLVLRRAAGNVTAARLLARAEAWRPWRAYAAMHLWRGAATAAPAPEN
jgi:AraC family transcriptional regulator of adaptative response / DNA-3-methyladenine glycosylase II